MSDLPTRVLAQGYLNYLREIRGDECYELCTHSVVTNCLEARASGELMTREEFIDSLDYGAAFVAAGYIGMLPSEVDRIIAAALGGSTDE